MKHPDINLLPQHYFLERARMRALRRWSTAISVAFLAMLAMLGLGGAQTQPVDTDSVMAKLNSTKREAERIEQQTQATIQSINATQRELASTRQISDQPDLSLLFEVIGQQLGDHAMLTAFRFGSIQEASIRANLGPSETASGGRWLVVTGIAEDHKAVPQVTLRLERLGLFDQVSLGETWAETYRGRSVVGFRMACRMPSSRPKEAGDE